MTRHAKWHWDQEDIWFFLEVDSDGWVTRQAELQGADSTPIAAIMRVEWEFENSQGRLDRYRERYGRGLIMDPFSDHEWSKNVAISGEEFDRTWRMARTVLDE